MESWSRFMPKGMLLRSEPFASNLWDPQRLHTLEAFFGEHGLGYAPVGRPTPIGAFLDYARWFQDKAVGDVRPYRAVQVDQDQECFVTDFEDGSRIRSRAVVLATGHMSWRRLPSELSKLPPERVFHSADLCELGGFSGSRVAVIGGGQAALETTALLKEAGAEVWTLVRADHVVWNGAPRHDPTFSQKVRSPEAGLGAGWRSLFVSEAPALYRLLPRARRDRMVANGWGPSGAPWLRPRIAASRLWTNAGVAGAFPTHDGVTLILRQDGSERQLTVDYVVAATGFAIDFSRETLLSETLRSRTTTHLGSPILDSSFQTSAPGLFVTGLASAQTFGPAMRFMYGAKRTAPAVVSALRRNSRIAAGRPFARGSASQRLRPTA